MNTSHHQEIISCETSVGFIEGKVSVHNIPEQIISDIHVSIKKGDDTFPQASRYIKVDESFHFIVEPGSYSLECALDQVKLRTEIFTVGTGERKAVHFNFINEA